MLRTLFSATILAGALAGSAMAQAPDAGCALPSEPKGIPAAIDAAITGPADKDRACMKALLIPEARMMFGMGSSGLFGFLPTRPNHNDRVPNSRRPKILKQVEEQ